MLLLMLLETIKEMPESVTSLIISRMLRLLMSRLSRARERIARLTPKPPQSRKRETT